MAHEAREYDLLIQRNIDVAKYNIRTHVIAQVVSYDRDKNLCVCQPVRSEVRTTDAANSDSVQLGTISDVPVALYGSGKTWCLYTPKPNTYGVLHISDRIIEDWMELGGIVGTKNVRCHDLSDAIFYPSVVPLVIDGDNGAFDAEDDYQPILEDRISLRTRSGLTQISVLEDESILIQTIKDDEITTSITIDGDGNVTLAAAGNLSATVTGDITAESTEGGVSVAADGDVTVESAGGNLSAVADGDVTIEAGGNLSATSGGTVTLDNGSGTIEIGSSGTVDINGNLTVDP